MSYEISSWEIRLTWLIFTLVSTGKAVWVKFSDKNCGVKDTLLLGLAYGADNSNIDSVVA